MVSSVVRWRGSPGTADFFLKHRKHLQLSKQVTFLQLRQVSPHVFEILLPIVCDRLSICFRLFDSRTHFIDTFYLQIEDKTVSPSSSNLKNRLKAHTAARGSQFALQDTNSDRAERLMRGPLWK